MEKTSFKRNTVDVWPDYGYFKQQPCDFGIDKENFPENSIFYLNQGYQSVKDNKKNLLWRLFLIGQVNECLNTPEDWQNYKSARTGKLKCIDQNILCNWNLSRLTRDAWLYHGQG